MRSLLARAPVVALLLSPLATPACVNLSTSSDDAGTSGASSSSGDDGGSTATVQGADCAPTPVDANVSLCIYISACPSLVLNAQVFPQCGFRIHGTAIDPECLCDNRWLCPIGNPTTCAEATADSSGDTTYDSVCEQAVEGTCTDLTAGSGSGSGGGSGSSGSGSGGTSSACTTCIDNCDNVPSCIDACPC